MRRGFQMIASYWLLDELKPETSADRQIIYNPCPYIVVKKHQPGFNLSLRTAILGQKPEDSYLLN